MRQKLLRMLCGVEKAESSRWRLMGTKITGKYLKKHP
jgi:hypothetical protein